MLHGDLEAGDKENQNNRIKVSMDSELYLKNYKIGTCGCHPVFSLASSVLFDAFPSVLMTHLVCKVSISTQECPPGTRLEYILDLGYPKRCPPSQIISIYCQRPSLSVVMFVHFLKYISENWLK